MARVIQTLRRKMMDNDWVGHPHREHRSKKGRRPIYEIAANRNKKFHDAKSKNDHTAHKARMFARENNLPFH